MARDIFQFLSSNVSMIIGGVGEVRINMEGRRFTNFFELEDEWVDYGIGDPFVLRYNGKYYLYCSTKDHRIGIKAWSSKNLLDWEYIGLVAEEEITRTAYAPEVVYWNGCFYMYTSPSGNGHYVLKSENPHGPFTVQTENLGMTIDGSVFIDDDGKWYFTHAGSDGIIGRKMKDPFSFGEPTTLNAYLGHWTEGSSIIKRKSTYYLTYTGNHVFSDGYRVHYATASDHPLGEYTEAANNPVILNTDADFRGLGHSATFLGPDLDSYYLVYHNLIGKSSEGPPVRKMNVDRLIFNGTKMSVLGPTNFEQMAPKMADFYTWLEDEGTDDWQQFVKGGTNFLLSPVATSDGFSAEFNMKGSDLSDQSEFGVIFFYENNNNYCQLFINSRESYLDLVEVKEGERKILDSILLPNEIDFEYLHSLRIEYNTKSLSILIDHLHLLERVLCKAGGGKIGYFFQHVTPHFHFTAFSNDTDGSSDYEVFKPIPGNIEAMHFMKHKNRGFMFHNGEEDTKVRVDSEFICKTAENDFSVLLNGTGDWLQYKINVSENSKYGIDFVYESLDKQTAVEVEINGKCLGEFSVPKGENRGHKWIKEQIAIAYIERGFQTFKMKLVTGSICLKSIDIYQVDNKVISIENALVYADKKNMHGIWERVSQGFVGNPKTDSKMYFGNAFWTDYKAELEFSLLEDSSRNNGGLLIRANNESQHEHQVSDSLRGYYISVNAQNLVLQKLNYDLQEIKSEAISLSVNHVYKLIVQVIKNDISVYLNEIKTPIITYKDPHAFMIGKAGIRSNCISMVFKRLLISTTTKLYR